MGFWDVAKNLLVGKPAFEEPKAPRQDDWDDDNPTDDFAEERTQKRSEAAGTSLYDSGGVKRIPVVGAERVKCNRSGNNMEVWATIHNHSQRAIELDKIILLGQKTELDYPLPPDGQREFRVFHGPVPTHDNYKSAELYYKDAMSGDYFRADHYIEYKYEADRTYSVEGLRLLTPIHGV